MFKLKIVITFLIVFSVSSAFPQQNKFTVSGMIKDKKTGETIIGATVRVKEMSGTGAASNEYGFYSLTIPTAKYTLIYSFLGYVEQVKEISLTQDLKIDVILEDNTTQLNEVVISAEKKNENVIRTQMGVEKLSAQEIKNIPVLMGEKDVLKTIQLLPGIKSVGEGNAGFFVRGGAADQNLILLDEATVYSASHLLGFFSVFNSDAIKDMTVYKGEMPSKYGGRLSSVLDIKMNDGNDKKFGVSGGIGLISSRLNIEGPIKKERGSFILSGRRTYADLFLKLSNDTNVNRARLYFYDFNLKSNYQIDDKNRIYLSGYFGKDVLGFGSQFGFDWGNTTATLRWNHIASSKLFSNTSLIFSNYNYNINIGEGDSKFSIVSKIQDWNLKQDFQYYAGTKSEIKFGLNSIYHKIVPGTVTSSDPLFTTVDFDKKYAWDNAAYVSYDYKLSPRINFSAGIRLSAFTLLGPGSFYDYNSAGEKIDSVVYASNEFGKTYVNPEPRFSTSYLLNEVSSVKAAYGRNTQSMHLLSNSASGNPTDLWVPSSLNVKPEISDQVSVGYFRNFKNNVYEFSVETYYKSMANQLDYKDGAEITFNEDVESELLYGKGRAYGAEFLIKKKSGRFNGWIGYTISRSEKKIVGINNGEYYKARQDRTHDISVVGIYELTKKWTISATWVYYTGNATTFPSGKYEIADQIVNYYTERNGYRMPSYHRLDLGATWIRKKTEKMESSWNFSLYNAYGRENAYTITFRENPDDASKTEAVQTSLFKWIPSVTYNFKF